MYNVFDSIITKADKNQIRKKNIWPILKRLHDDFWVGNLFVCSIPKLYIHEKKSFWIFQNGGFFAIANVFLANKRFCKYQLILWPDLIFFKYLKIDVNRFFCSSSGSGDQIYAKTQVSKTAICVFFVAHCTSINKRKENISWYRFIRTCLLENDALERALEEKWWHFCRFLSSLRPF